MDSGLRDANNLHDGMSAFTDQPMWPSLPAQYTEPHWYAAYTSANHEKRVAEQLEARQIEHFLPSYASVRRWKDRRVTLQLPLFPGYLFVRMALRNRLPVLQIPGIAKLVGFGTLPAPLPKDEIEALQTGLAKGLHAEPHPYLTVGQRVRVKHGPLAGMEGVLLRWKGNWRVVLSLDLIQRSVAVDVDASLLEAIPSKWSRTANKWRMLKCYKVCRPISARLLKTMDLRRSYLSTRVEKQRTENSGLALILAKAAKNAPSGLAGLPKLS